jgi:hypothetical protein
MVLLREIFSVSEGGKVRGWGREEFQWRLNLISNEGRWLNNCREF